ncbi:MAG: alpha/beta fold hydrolase [Ferruginibacter sp.]
MKQSKFFAIFLFSLLTISTVSGQDFLSTYFNGNKDTLVAEATKLVNMPDPTFKSFTPTKIDTATLADKGLTHKPVNYYFTVRDKHKIFAYKFPKKSPKTIILIHGVKSSAKDYLKTAGLLQQATQAEIYAIDLRGHGKSYGKSGDVNYINQYADDLADIVTSIRKKKPNGKIIIAGHSMGGGITLRYAMTNYKEKVDGFLLFAPLIGQNSPAFPQGQVADTDSSEAFMKIHIARIIGLKMLNEIDRHEKDSLPVLVFNLPKGTPLREYSYRANTSMAPDDYIEGLKAVKIPMLVLVGNKDEAFVAEAQQKAVLGNSKGEVKIIDGATHESILQSTLVFQLISKWFSKL